MHKQTIVILIGALTLLAAGGILVPQLFDDGVAPPMRWSEHDEVELMTDSDAAVEGDATDAVQRIAMESANGTDPASAEARVAVVLRGRVTDKFQTPVAGARVWLDFGRQLQRGGPAGRQRRVPAPVETDAEGRFAFEGQTFRQLRVSLQVLHAAHAPGLFEKDVGEVSGEVDLGDLVLSRGGEVAGRVTDLDGNGIAGAQLHLQPENDNRMRMLRERENLLVAFVTDNNGYYRRPTVAAGDWAVTATAKMHTEGRSATFAVEDEQVAELEDIRLGPGYEVTGYVRTLQGQPIAKAEVTLRGEARPGGGGRAQGGRVEAIRAWGGREHRATTDEQGRFFLEHLPGAAMRLDARAEGFLDFRQDAVDPALGQPIHVALQDGLKITGTALDEDGTPVTSFAARATRIRGLQSGQQAAEMEQMMTRMRSGNLDDATLAQLRTRVERAREGALEAFEGQRRGGREDGGERNPARPENHPGGEFVLTGLQEGVYEVRLQSKEHAPFRSAEIEVRAGATPPNVRATLDRGVYVAGVVTDTKMIPIAGARVSLRTAVENEGTRRRGRGGPEAPDLQDMARQFLGNMSAQNATTNADGEFVLKHVARGNYRVQAESDGFANATTEPFELQADRSDLALQLGSLGMLTGNVRGLSSAELPEARVAAVRTSGQGGPGGAAAFFGRGRGGGGGPMQNVSVAADGTYRIEKLEPGDYIVRSWLGSPQDLMREIGPQVFGGTVPADVTVRGGETSELDVTVHRPQVGTVTGSVLHNGAPGAGLQVDLQLQDEAGNGGGERPVRGEGPGGRGGFFGGRSFQAVVSTSGSFTIEKVPAGVYRLRVQAGRRGGVLHEESIQVFADAKAERTIVLVTQEVRGAVSRDDGGDPAELNGRASLLPGLSALPADLATWQRENRTFEARVQNGTFRFEALQPGQYLLLLTIRGRERAVQSIFVGAGQTQEIAVAAGKVNAAGATPASGPGAGAAGPGGKQPANTQPR